MPSSYSQRSLTVLTFLGILSAIMSVLSVILIFQLQSNQAGIKAVTSPPSGIPAEISGVLLPVAAVLTALSLTLNLSSVVVCLLHGYFATEICRQDVDTDRADWLLLDSRGVRHVAIGLFCLGVSVYLTALSIYMLMLFEIETGIASACILSSGILVLLVMVVHSLLKASRTAKNYRSELPNTMFQNDHDHDHENATPATEPSGGIRETQKPQARLEIHRQFSYPPYSDDKQLLCSSPSGSHLTSTTGSHRADSSAPRMHRTLSAESGLLQGQAQPWNGINSEMRTVLARKSGGTGKDSTLV
ncbi:TM221 protein, partial [Polyodon spathula]|nr:TM221 protein [Polyodon spathula]